MLKRTPQGFLTCERRYIFELLIISAGMMGAYTYNLRGGVFCNAQTANLMVMAAALGHGEIEQALYYLIPISAYMLGSFLSEMLPNPVKKFGWLRWDTYLIGFEIIALFIIGLIPLSAPHQIVQVLINFICAMQLNTFREAEGIPMATTICTNHVRQVGVGFAKFVMKKKKMHLKRSKEHLVMILAFMLGSATLSALCNALQEKAIWVAIMPLLISFGILVYADLVREHDVLANKPLGH